MLYKWAEQPEHAAGSGIGNPFDRIEALLKSTGDQRIAQWICQRANGFFIPNPKGIPHPHYLIPATNQIVQEFADLLAVIAKAAHDSEVTPPRRNKFARAGRHSNPSRKVSLRVAKRGILTISAIMPSSAPRRFPSRNRGREEQKLKAEAEIHGLQNFL